MSNKTTQPRFPRGKKAGLDAETASAHRRQAPHLALSLLVLPSLTLSPLPPATAADPLPAPATPTTTQPTAKPCTPGWGTGGGGDQGTFKIENGDQGGVGANGHSPLQSPRLPVSQSPRPPVPPRLPLPPSPPGAIGRDATSSVQEM
ncbi:hypothetical protein [[Phormidium] sp. ETS-05]|uniref:hypothetical protein n=1 Tax=[Phormidium] sp. ETS-05 TaxID=222819 RepID=UPI0018EEDAE9|nr:hypothetical protein [[Phormidium] sp. ETS-05]